MDKFGRNYHLLIQKKNGQTLDVELPFTIEFDITRNILNSLNLCTIRIYNLAPNNRDQIRKNIQDYKDTRSVTLQAGYGTNLPIVFTGTIRQAYSFRQGADFITHIEGFDGGFDFVNGITNKSFKAGTAQSEIIRTLVDSLKDLKPGAIGTYPGVISRGNAFSGNTIEILNDITGGGVFIDNGHVHVINNDEYVPGGIPVINSQSGLLNTPLLEETQLTFDMIFEPGLIVGQKIQLDSSTGLAYNGPAKVFSVSHRGTISDAVCGDAITTVRMLWGLGPLRAANG